MSTTLDRSGSGPPAQSRPPAGRPPPHQHGGVPGCDIPAFCRSVYYRGKLLTERDFSDEQRYHADRMRLHHLALHGWGIVCGLKVWPHKYCPQLRLVVGDGLAIDSCGREVRMLHEIEVELPKAPPPPSDKGQYGAPEGHGDDEEQSCQEPLPARTLYLCLCYDECAAEFGPAPFDECGCNSDGQLKPNRICEGARVELYDEKPAFWDAAVGLVCEAEDCQEWYHEAAEHCVRPGMAPCIPLAVIMDVVPGEAVKPGQIRTHGYRRMLPSTATLDQVVRCILEKLPAEKLTRIDETNWQHGQRYLCREFMSEFISSEQHRRGFRIQFTDKVRAEKIDPRSFQAMVVFRPEDPAMPRHMETAPAEVDRDDDDTDWCVLRINPTYARNRLDMKDFDLFITLRCDCITDCRDLAVDGDFIANRFPTGDNIQGGAFESWIRVRPRHAVG